MLLYFIEILYNQHPSNATTIFAKKRTPYIPIPKGRGFTAHLIKPDKTRNGAECARRLVSAYRELGWFRHMSDGLSCPICGGPVRIEPYGPIPGKYVLTHYQRDNPNCPIAHNFGHSLGAGLYNTGYEAAAAWRSGHSGTP